MIEDEKWIYSENPRRSKSWVGLGKTSISIARSYRFRKKTMLCIWWEQKGAVYHELLKPIKIDTTSALGWKFLPHLPYSSSLASYDYNLFSSMSQGHFIKLFNNYEDVKKWLDDWITLKDVRFSWEGIHKSPERWEKCVTCDGAYFE